SWKTTLLRPQRQGSEKRAKAERGTQGGAADARPDHTYIQRYLERLNYALAQVEAEHDFSINEVYVYNRENENWFASDEEADEQWRKRVKYDLLNLKLSSTGSDSTDAKNQET